MMWFLSLELAIKSQRCKGADGEGFGGREEGT